MTKVFAIRVQLCAQQQALTMTNYQIFDRIKCYARSHNPSYDTRTELISFSVIFRAWNKFLRAFWTRSKNFSFFSWMLVGDLAHGQSCLVQHMFSNFPFFIQIVAHANFPDIICDVYRKLLKNAATYFSKLKWRTALSK